MISNDWVLELTNQSENDLCIYRLSPLSHVVRNNYLQNVNDFDRLLILLFLYILHEFHRRQFIEPMWNNARFIIVLTYYLDQIDLVFFSLAIWDRALKIYWVYSIIYEYILWIFCTVNFAKSSTRLLLTINVNAPHWSHIRRPRSAEYYRPLFTRIATRLNSGICSVTYTYTEVMGLFW